MPSSSQIDPRGPRLTASITLIVLAVALVTPRPVSIVLVVLQALCFLIGAARGVQFTPTAWAFRTFIKPRLSRPRELEDARPPRFAQAVGLGFTVVALIGYAAGATLLGQIAVGFAVAAALLNSVFGLCLGCEMYLLIQRIKTPLHSSANKKEAIA